MLGAMPELDPTGRVVDLGTVRLRTPGLAGEVTVYDPTLFGAHAGDESSPALREALWRADVTEALTLEIVDHEETTEPMGSRVAGADDDLVLEVDAPGEGLGQVVLYEAEDGSVSWHVPVDRPTTLAAAGPVDGALDGAAAPLQPATYTYRIPRAVVPAPDEPESFGVLGRIGTKVLKVLVFPVVDEAASYIGDKLARRFEAKHRRHRLRDFSPEGYAAPTDDDLDADALRRLAEGPALLFLHGTTSTAHAAFGRVPRAVVAELHRRYDGRVFAFDHPSVSADPRENVAWLADELRPLGDRSLDVDVVAHSRGGLVGRLLAEQPALVDGRLTVGRLVLVATPNEGTVLASPDRIGDLLNRLTTLLQVSPGPDAADGLDAVLAVVKQVALGAFSGLDGVMAMNPTGAFLTRVLNQPSQTQARYAAVASDFEPPDGSPLLRIAKDAGADIAFADAANDLVVPTEGSWSAAGATPFPVEDRVVFGTGDGVDHSGFWRRPRFTEQLLEWLPAR